MFKKCLYLYKQSLIKIIIMENKVEYIMVKELTKKQNRKNIIRFLGGGMLFAMLAMASMYFFLFFILWANEITDKVVGYF